LMKIVWFEEAWDDYLSWQLQDKKPLSASINSYKTLYATATAVLASRNR